MIFAQKSTCLKEIVLKQFCDELYGLSKSAEIVLSKSILYVNNFENFFKKNSFRNMDQFRRPFFKF